MLLINTGAREWKGHIFPMIKGKRAPARPKPRAKWSNAENAKLMKDHEAAKVHLRQWELSKVFSRFIAT